MIYLASIEYAIKYIGSKVLMVLGHTECGAIKSAKQGVADGHITDLVETYTTFYHQGYA